MDKHLRLRRFSEEWGRYLRQHGHLLAEGSEGSEIVVSRNGRGRRFRWLLRATDNDSILLGPAYRKTIRRQARLARRAGERCFLVVTFWHPESKVLVMPALEAVKAKRIRSNRGGIPWEC